MDPETAVLEAPGKKPVLRLSGLEWLRYGPFLVQMVVIRRCNLSCTYCTEFDRTSDPVPFEVLEDRLERLHALRTWAVCLTGGEPTLHPDLSRLLAVMKRHGFRRRMMITNGYKLTRESVEMMNREGLTDLQVSVDGVRPNEVTKKVLDCLRPRLELLAQHARFTVTLSGVIGSAPPKEALEVVDFAKKAGFTPRILLIHDEHGRLQLSPEELAAYREVKRRIGPQASEGHNYRDRLIEKGEAPFKCRAGSRYLYLDEFGAAHWCSQTREVFGKPLEDYTLDDLRRQFHTRKACDRGCTVGCVRSASAWDEWRPQ